LGLIILVYFMAIWYFLVNFGNFMAIRYLMSNFGIFSCHLVFLGHFSIFSSFAQQEAETWRKSTEIKLHGSSLRRCPQRNSHWELQLVCLVIKKWNKFWAVVNLWNFASIKKFKLSHILQSRLELNTKHHLLILHIFLHFQVCETNIPF
jgi:hypothetical protein